MVVLRALKQAGIANGDVDLVELPSTQFLTALQSGQVDAAPLGEPTLTKYLTQYAGDGARRVPTDVVDLLTVLWAPIEVLNDPAKREKSMGNIPWHRPGRPEEIAGLAVFLCTDDADYVTGQTWVMDGGLTMNWGGA